MFTEFSYLMEQVANMYHQTGSGKSKMAASKLQVRKLSLYTRYQRNTKCYTYIFGVQLSNGTILQYPITNDRRVMKQYIVKYAKLFLLHNFGGIEQLKS